MDFVCFHHKMKLFNLNLCGWNRRFIKVFFIQVGDVKFESDVVLDIDMEKNYIFIQLKKKLCKEKLGK